MNYRQSQIEPTEINKSTNPPSEFLLSIIDHKVDEMRNNPRFSEQQAK